MIRLFVALRLPGSVRAAIREAAAPLMGVDLSIRWTPVEQLHITLHFLGDVAAASVHRIDRYLADAALGSERFTLSLGGVGAFPSMKRPRVIWLGAAPSPGVSALHRSVESALAHCGFEPDRRSFRPHVTLGRVRNPRRGFRHGADPSALARVAAAIDVRMDVSFTHVYLMRSRLGPGGADHTVVGSYRLSDEPVLPTGSC